MDSHIARSAAAAAVVSAVVKPFPVVGDGIGHAIEALGKILELADVRLRSELTR